MSERGSAIVAGHLCLDIIPEFNPLASFDFKKIFKPGGLTRVGPAILSTGGAVSNTGLLLHRSGIPTRLVAKTGDDVFGQAIRGIVAGFGENLEGGIIIDPDVNTSYTVIISPPGFDRLFLHCPGANDSFDSGDIPFEEFAQARLFHFGYPPTMKRIYQNDGEELEKIFRLAKQTGISNSLDLCMPDPSAQSGRVDWLKILRRVLPYVDIFVPSLDEILYMLDRKLYDAYLGISSLKSLLSEKPALLSELGRRLLDMGPKILMLKLGNCGAYLRTAEAVLVQQIGRAGLDAFEQWGNRELWAPCFRVNVVGTTGSGDATIAGFLSALMRGFSPEKALTSAVAVGACNVEAADALSGVPDWEAVQKRIESGWERLKTCDNPVGWLWSQEHQLWIGPGDMSTR